MNLENVITMLGEFGLSISLVVAFVGMFWKMYNQMREDGKEREIREFEQITHLSGILSENSKALLKNSEVMEKISGKIDCIDERIEEVQKDVQEIKIRQSQNEK